MASLIKLRRDTSTNWTTANPVLQSGEPGLETNTGFIKYGDGVTAWNSLPYAGGSASTGNIGFIGDSIYDLNGVIVENADLGHGATAALILPANGDANAVQLNNLYGNLTVATSGNGVGGLKTWTFGGNGNLTFPDGTTTTGSTITTPTGNTFSVTTSSLVSVSAPCYIAVGDEFVADTEFNDDITVVQVGWTVDVGGTIYTVTSIDPAPPANQYRITAAGATFVQTQTYTFTDPVPVTNTWGINQTGVLSLPGNGTISQINNDLFVTVSGTDIIGLRTNGGDVILDAQGNLNIPGQLVSTTSVSRLSLNEEGSGNVYLTSTDDNTTAIELSTTNIQAYSGVAVNITSGVLLPGLETNYTDSQIILEDLFTQNSVEPGYPWGITLPVSYLTYSELILLAPDTFPNQTACTAQANSVNNNYELWQGTLADSDINITAANNQWVFGSDGNLTIPGNMLAQAISSPLPVISGFAFVGDGGSLSNVTGNIAFSDTTIYAVANTATQYLNISYNGEGWGYLQLPSDATANMSNVRIHNDVGNIELGTGGGSNLWYFDNTGKLVLPGGYTVGEPGGPSLAINSPGNRYGIDVTWNNSTGINIGTQTVSIDSSGGWAFNFTNSGTGYTEGVNADVPTTGGSGTGMTVGFIVVSGVIQPETLGIINQGVGYLVDDVITITGGNSDAQFTISGVTGTNSWTFDQAGNLVLPSNTSSINYANGQPYGGSGGSGGPDLINGTNYFSLDSSAAAILTLSNVSGPKGSFQGRSDSPDILIDSFTGNVVLSANDNQEWNFGVNGNLTLPTNGSINFNAGSIVQTPMEDLDIRVQDSDNDGWSLFNTVDDGAGTVLGRTRLQRDSFDVNIQGYAWQFNNSGVLGLPGNVAGNVGGNLFVNVVDQPGSDTFIDLRTTSYAGDTLISNIRITNPNVTISTANEAYTWQFGGDSHLILPGNIQSINTGFPFSSSIADITTGTSNVIVTLNNAVFPDAVSGTVTISGVIGTTEANNTWGFQATAQDAFQLFTDDTLSTPVDGTTWTAYVEGGAALSVGYNDFSIRGGNVDIRNGVGNSWTFNATGNLVLPNGGAIANDGNNIVITNSPLLDGEITIEANATVNIYGGSTAVPSQSGGRININGGDGGPDSVDGGGWGGEVEITAGSGADAIANIAGNGGQVRIIGGNGGIANSANSIVAGSGGTVYILGGNAGDVDGNNALAVSGPNVEIHGGLGSFNGTTMVGRPGDAILQGGGNGWIGASGNVYTKTSPDGYSFNTWAFDNTGVLTLPGEGIIQSLNDTVILRSVDTGTGNVFSARLGTNGGLYFEGTEYPQGWLNLVNNSGSADINALPGTAGGAGKSISINAGAADQTDFYTTPGGNVNITGGLGASNDGGGGGPGGNINITSGVSADPAGHAGNINITAGTNNWVFDYTGTTTLPTVTNESAKFVGTRKIVGGLTATAPYAVVLNAGGTPTVAYTALAGTQSVKVSFAVSSNGAGFQWEQFDVVAVPSQDVPGAVNFVVSNRVKGASTIPDTVVTATMNGSQIEISLTLDAVQTLAGTASFDAVEFGLMAD